MKNKLLIFLAFLLLALPHTARPESLPEMADAFRSNGKIYVVVACLLLVLTGVLIFLLMLEKRLSKIENQRKG
jgi:hypothetical protein